MDKKCQVDDLWTQNWPFNWAWEKVAVCSCFLIVEAPPLPFYTRPPTAPPTPGAKPCTPSHGRSFPFTAPGGEHRLSSWMCSSAWWEIIPKITSPVLRLSLLFLFFWGKKILCCHSNHSPACQRSEVTQRLSIIMLFLTNWWMKVHRGWIFFS